MHNVEAYVALHAALDDQGKRLIEAIDAKRKPPGAAYDAYTEMYREWIALRQNQSRRH